VPDVQVFEVNRLLIRKRIENALEHCPVLVAMHPMLIYPGFHLFEFEAGVGVKGEPVPVLPFHPEVSNK
jgi:hypothetical protein